MVSTRRFPSEEIAPTCGGGVFPFFRIDLCSDCSFHWVRAPSIPLSMRRDVWIGVCVPVPLLLDLEVFLLLAATDLLLSDFPPSTARERSLQITCSSPTPPDGRGIALSRALLFARDKTRFWVLINCKRKNNKISYNQDDLRKGRLSN